MTVPHRRNTQIDGFDGPRVAAADSKSSPHITLGDLELFHSGKMEAPALSLLEEHLLVCPPCAHRAEVIAQCMNVIRAGIIAWD